MVTPLQRTRLAWYPRLATAFLCRSRRRCGSDRISVDHLAQKATDEVKARSMVAGSKIGVSDAPDGESSFYGACAAINIRAVFGLPLGSVEERGRWKDHLLSWQRPDGSFPGNDAAHAVCMAIMALNILGFSIPSGFSPLAPTSDDSLLPFLKSLDWTGTHKGFWGLTIPRLVNRSCSSRWARVVLDYITESLRDEEPERIWCGPNDPGWRVISCIYHIVGPLMAARVDLPKPLLLHRRLIRLGWPHRRRYEYSTNCSDADWAFVLAEAAKSRPMEFVETRRQIERVSHDRVKEWNSGRVEFHNMDLFQIYCYLWSTAHFQSQCPQHFCGPFLYDTLNSPNLFRLG